MDESLGFILMLCVC